MIVILLNICNILTMIFQCFLIVWACDNLASKENKISKLKSGFLGSIIAALSIGSTFSNIKMPYSNLILVIGALLSCVIFYRKSYKDAILGFGMGYSIIAIASYFLRLLYKCVIVKINFNIPSDLKMFIFVFIPLWLIGITFFKFSRHIFNAIVIMKTYVNHFKVFIIMTYTLIFIDTLRVEVQVGTMDDMFRFTFYFIISMIFSFVIIYFARIKKEAKEFELLNVALNLKITELRKIKHDYGSEISGLYGLYQLGKIDRLGEMLKNIVSRNQAVNTSIYVNVQATPLVNSILSPIASSNINLIVSDIADYEKLSITDNELLKVLSNIIRNSVDVLKNVNDPIIKFKSYNIHDGVVINICNNGPEITKEIKEKIFESGFSTKNNSNDDRGFGLSIVKDIINKYNGKITIDSCNECTEFIIKIPYNKSSFKKKF